MSNDFEICPKGSMALALEQHRQIEALTAHVDRLTALLRELEDTMPVTPHIPMARIKGDYLERVDAAIKASPATSLARHEASKAKEIQALRETIGLASYYLACCNAGKAQRILQASMGGDQKYDDTCGGIHPPFSETVWPSHCHTRRCPRCGRDYPI